MTTYKKSIGKRIKRFATDLNNDQAEGQIFYSDTDTEIISNLIEFYIDTSKYSIEETKKFNSNKISVRRNIA